MDAAISWLPHRCPHAPPRPPLPPSRLRPALPARCPSLTSSPLHLRRRHDESRARHTSPSLSPLRSRRRGSNAAAAGTVAFWGWASSRRKRGGRGGVVDRAAVERWASILLLAGSIQRLVAMQTLDVLAALLEHGGGAAIKGGGDGVVGLLSRGLWGGGRTKKRKRTWKGPLRFAIKAASAAAAAAAIWLLLFGKRLL